MSHLQTHDANKYSLLQLVKLLTTVTFDLGVERSLLLKSVKDSILSNMDQLEDFERFLEFSEAFESSVNEEDRSSVKTQLRRFLDDYVEKDAEGLERSGEVEEYAETLEYVADIFGFTVAQELDWLNSMANELSVKEQEEERDDYYADLAREEFGRPAASAQSPGDSIASMFETLIHD